MQGFDPKFKDFPDYILGITKEIWEDRGIDTLHHYYSDDMSCTCRAVLCWATETSLVRPWQRWRNSPIVNCWVKT